MNVLAWVEARAQEATTWTGIIGFIATTIFHKQLGATDVGAIATIAAGLVSGGLIAVTSKNPTALVNTVIGDIRQVITVAGDLHAQAQVALASGEGAKYQALMDAHAAANSTVN